MTETEFILRIRATNRNNVIIPYEIIAETRTEDGKVSYYDTRHYIDRVCKANIDGDKRAVLVCNFATLAETEAVADGLAKMTDQKFERIT